MHRGDYYILAARFVRIGARSWRLGWWRERKLSQVYTGGEGGSDNDNDNDGGNEGGEGVKVRRE